MKAPYIYSQEPDDAARFTEEFDRGYAKYADLYAAGVKVMPFWKRWLKSTLPHIKGPRVLEASSGTGYLLSHIARHYPRAIGLDFNRRMVELASEELRRKDLTAEVAQGDIQKLPFADGSFDSVVCTMAFSGYPDGVKALTEMQRVLKNDGVLVLVDPAPPGDGNWLGVKFCRFWQSSGDIIRDMPALFERVGFDFQDIEIGGFGAIHLWIAKHQA